MSLCLQWTPKLYNINIKNIKAFHINLTIFLPESASFSNQFPTNAADFVSCSSLWLRFFKDFPHASLNLKALQWDSLKKRCWMYSEIPLSLWVNVCLIHSHCTMLQYYLRHGRELISCQFVTRAPLLSDHHLSVVISSTKEISSHLWGV